MRRWVLAALLALAACSPPPEPANPALWRVDGPGGQHGWLFGTIHALPRRYDWKTPGVSAALGGADLLVVEIARLNDDAETARVFAALGTTPGQPPLDQRVSPALRPALGQLLAKAGMKPEAFGNRETWAAALALASAASAGEHVEWGVDRALLKDAGTMPVAELEGAEGQLRAFDRLAEPEQRRLLEAVVVDADKGAGEAEALAQAWAHGDVAAIARETNEGFMADPGLRKALFGDRNAAWVRAIAAALTVGRHPFVAVGAAHMAGPDGLPALLAARGYKVTRVE